jgi:hypothetical protein
MNRNLGMLLIVILTALALLLGGVALNSIGLGLSSGGIVVVSLVFLIGVAVLVSPKFKQKVVYAFSELDWAEEVSKAYYKIPAKLRKSFWLLFLFINLAYLFHTVNFMWGSGDWGAVRRSVPLGEGLEEGRFSAYFLQNVLFDGKILPVINNLFAFAGLALGAVLLGIWWQLPLRSTPFVVAGLLLAANPYALSWLYFAKNTLGNFWLPVWICSAFLLAGLRGKTAYHTYVYNLLSILLLILALGTYLPVINFIAVALLGKIFIQTVYADISLKNAFLRELQQFVNLTAAVMLYVFIVLLLKEEGILHDAYNTKLASALEIFSKIGTLFVVMIEQFFVELPFLGLGYKIVGAVLVVATLFSLIFSAPSLQATLRGFLMFLLVLIGSQLTYLFSVQSELNPAHLVRIDFYGLVPLYVLMFTLLIKLNSGSWRRAVYVVAILFIFMGCIRVSYAQKVWKFGFDAESKLAERIITRLEKMPEFDITRQYKFLQIGEVSLRQKFYLKNPKELKSGDLLEWSYYPEGSVKEAYNFFYQTDFISDDAKVSEAMQIPAIKEFVEYKGRPWPAKESILIYDDYIVLLLK